MKTEIEKFREALNLLIGKMNVRGTFGEDGAKEVLHMLTQKGESEELVIAKACAAAYGFENISVHDAQLLVDSHVQTKIQETGAKLQDVGNATSSFGLLIDVLVSHWKNFSSEEKKVIANSVAAMNQK